MMSEQVISVLDALCEKFGVAVDWTQGNVLPYARELCGRYINYEIATSVAWIVISFVISAALIISAVIFYKKSDYADDIYDILSLVCTISGTAACIVTFVVSVHQVIDIITCLTFPEKMIIEFAYKLMNAG